ncbi:hypothetical protein F5887DRAFT_919024 [Amanita rubescens]|nr:hypothetical protein F5887DRAFT_919024 [Amanita rubescens]
MPGASVFIREQPQKTVLTEEQQKGSSFSDLKPAKPTFSDSFSEPGKVMAERSPLSPLRPSVLSGPLQSNLGERTRPRVTSVASLRVSATETQNSAERVQLTRCMAVLSSAKPDHLPAPQGLELSAPRFTREPPSARKSTLTSHNALKSIPEMDSAISWPSPSLSVRAKAQEQSIETVLDRESPKGSPHIDLKLFGPDVSAPAPSTCGIARMPERSPAGKGEVSLEKRMSAVKHSPVAEAAPTPPKSMPVSYIRALPASSSKDGVPLSPRVIPMQRTPIGVNTRRVVNDTTHRQDETPRVFRKPSSPRYETPSPAISERRNLSVVMSTTPKSSSWLSPSRNAISTSRNSTPVSFIPRAPPVNKPNDRIAMSLQMVSTRRAPNIVNTRRVVKVDAHHHDETCSRVSSKAVNPRIGKTPIAGVEGRSNKRSNVNRGPAIKQALMSSLSSEMGERRRVPDTVVSKIKGTMEETHSPFDNATLLLLESVQTFPILTPYNRPFVEGIVSSSFEVSTPVTLGVVNNGRLASIGTDQEVKTLTRVSSKTTVPRSDKPLAECSNLEEGYAVEQALAFSHSTEVGKGRQACNAAVINEQKEEEASSPSEVPVVPVQSVSTPDASSFTPVRDVPLRLFSDKYIPPVEELSRRHDVSVVCKTSEVCSSHSRSLETTRKRAIVSTVPFSVEGEGQLKRAAAYIQERIKRRSSVPDEFPRYGSKGPPDKRMEITSTAIESRRLETDVIRARLEARTTLTLSPCRTKGVKLSHSSPEATLELPDSSLGTSVTDGRDLKPRQLGQAVEAIRCSDECLKTEDSVLEESVIAPRVLKNEWAPGPDEGQPVSWKVVSKTEMRSACLHSPVTSAALTPFALLPAFLSQALPSSLLSSELSGFLTKSSGEGDCEWRHNKVANSPNNPGVGTQSPESKIRVVTLVSKPSFSLSVHAKAQEQPIKAVLNVTFLSSSKRCENRESAKHSVDKVNIRAGKGLGAAERSPFTNAVSTLRRSLPVPSLRAPHARYFKDGATPSFPMNSTRRMLGVVNTRRVVSVMTHLKPETPSRVSCEVASTRSDKAPSAGAQGRSDERSNSAAGPAVEQALVLSSLKEGEERRACDAVISILRKNEGEFSPEASVARGLYCPPPIPIGVRSESEESYRSHIGIYYK